MSSTEPLAAVAVPDYPECVRFLYSLGYELKSTRFGLEGMRRLVAALGHPERSFRCVHVAGTNGKGSTAAMIEAGLAAAGFHTGLYTSPHLIEPLERIRIGGEDSSREAFAAAFAAVHEVARRLLAAGRLETHPSFFETLTAMGFEAFRRAAIDWGVLEVGLGGRLDATTVAVPEVTVITPVDFDHEKILGSTLGEIAGEKAGILKPGVPLALARQHAEADAVIRTRARELEAEVTPSAAWHAEDLHCSPEGIRFRASGPTRLRVECPLAGAYQVENALTAVAALHLAGVATEAIEAGFRRVRWPGRLERIGRHPEIVLDGAHNAAGARALAAHIREFYGGRKVWLVFGSLADKAPEMAAILLPLAAEVILTAPDHPRAARPESFLGYAAGRPARVADSIGQAIEWARQAPDAVFVTGSLYLVGAARAILLDQPPAAGP
jgi:dihydrofolate synthase / folylpolyglutamate synthase